MGSLLVMVVRVPGLPIAPVTSETDLRVPIRPFTIVLLMSTHNECPTQSMWGGLDGQLKQGPG